MEPNAMDNSAIHSTAVYPGFSEMEPNAMCNSAINSTVVYPEYGTQRR